MHDLDIWMVTAARPDYVAGVTHFAVYGHNHTIQDLSFNRLKDVCVGDVFTYTCGSDVYVYDVTSFFSDWRENVTAKYVDDFSLSPSLFYIISCGRGEHRYKDIVVEGTLRAVVPASDFYFDPVFYRDSFLKDEGVAYKEEDLTDTVSASCVYGSDLSVSGSVPFPADETLFDGCVSGEGSSSAPVLISSFLDVHMEDGKLSASCLSEDGCVVSCTMALFDSDGLVLARWQQPGDMPSVSLEDGASYAVGVLSVGDLSYEEPQAFFFKYHDGGISYDGEKDSASNGAPVWGERLFFALLVLFISVLGCVCVTLFVRDFFGERCV